MKILVYSFLLQFILYMTISAQREIEVTGKLVDQNEKPIKNAQVTWSYEPEIVFLGGQTHESYLTMDDGYFGFVAQWRKGTKIRIYIEDSGITDCFRPIDIKNKNLSDDLRFKGILISKYRPGVFLGSISKYIKYGKVRISLRNVDHSVIEEIKNRLVYLQIHNSQGRLINNDTLNPAYSEANNRLEICLPVGKWHMSITRNSSVNRQKSFEIQVRPKEIKMIDFYAVANQDK